MKPRGDAPPPLVQNLQYDRPHRREMVEVPWFIRETREADMVLRALLVEDRPADADLALAYLNRGGFKVIDRRVDSTVELDPALAEFAPDVVLCDDGLPGLTTLEALKVTKAVRPATPFIVVTGALDMPSAVACLNAGADDVLLKSDLARLASAVRHALEVRSTLVALSPRQVEVLRHVVDGLTTRAIAERLGLSLKTVETHRTEMMRRLDIHDVARLVRYAVKVRLIAPEG